MKNKILVFGLITILTVGMGLGVLGSVNNFTFANSTDKSIEQSKMKENEDDKDFVNVKTAITKEAAKQTALDSIANGTFKKIELEDENGVLVYGIEINAASLTHDVKVDANTGKILASDEDNEDESIDGIDVEGQDNDQVENENENETEDENEDSNQHED